MNIFGVGLPEMAIILIVALLVFGPKKLPEISKSIGKALRSFQEASKDFENQFQQEASQIEQALSLTSTAAEIAGVEKVEEVEEVEEVKEAITPSYLEEEAKPVDHAAIEIPTENS